GRGRAGARPPGVPGTPEGSGTGAESHAGSGEPRECGMAKEGSGPGEDDRSRGGSGVGGDHVGAAGGRSAAREPGATRQLALTLSSRAPGVPGDCGSGPVIGGSLPQPSAGWPAGGGAAGEVGGTRQLAPASPAGCGASG